MTVTQLGREMTALRCEFDTLVADLRPELHRYCARILASAADGEDAVQDALADAYYRLPMLSSAVPLRRWLFSLAHDHCVTRLNRLPAAAHGDQLGDMKAAAALNEILANLPPTERVALVMKDVLGFPLAEIASLLGIRVGAVKSALHRGRATIERVRASRRPQLGPDNGQALCERYSSALRRHDLTVLRGLLADSVRVEIVGRRLVDGRDMVEREYLRPELAMAAAFRLEVVEVKGRRHLLRLEDGGSRLRPHSLLSVDCHGDAIYEIRDYFHVPYLIDAMAFDEEVERSGWLPSSVATGKDGLQRPDDTPSP